MNDFLYGLKKGWAIGLGYLAVSFAFGVYAVQGITPLLATILSLSNLTSSGQFAGVKMIIEEVDYKFEFFIEIGLTVFLINLRYILMSISLSQKIDDTIPTWKRLLFGYGITDEIYAVAITEDRKVTASYMAGLIILPVLGWTSGTALGAFGASFIDARLLDALGIALYAMFIAIIIPDMKKSLPVVVVVLIAVGLSCMFHFVPGINQLGSGYKVIIVTIASAAIGASIFPIEKKEVAKEC